MHYEHSKEQATEYAKLAMNRIRRDGFTATPHIYELWYVYYSGQSPEIKKKIDALIADKQNITDKQCMDIHRRHLSEEYKEDLVSRAGDEMNNTINSFSGVVEEAKSATEQYSGKLGGVSEQMTHVSDPEEFKAILGTVMNDTEEMINRNEKLEKELEHSTEIVNKLKKDLENIRQEALTDGLTGLANRKSFDTSIDEIQLTARTEDKPFSLMMMDIDHFKTFNDNYGHQVGDQVIRLVSRTLIDGVKGRDIAARYGGEEFAVILPETPLEGAVRVAETLRVAIADKEIVNRSTGNKLGKITVSIGVAEYSDGETVHDMIERADEALYAAKHNGRNQVAAAPKSKPKPSSTTVQL
ncbi:MAG: GGDEF domain-containing protein [Alphaproteobacteria bacterium]|nr:GGDEF domain-containing protein [Alphaproteobacteria bacterium]MDP7221870.1 GGDEF domain-containing protein [Alphaproteobacteria bacterium]